MRNFFDLLSAQEAEGKCINIALDSELERIPKSAYRQWKSGEKKDVVTGAMTAFNMAIVEATNDLVCAYSLDLALYLAYGASGVAALRRIIMIIQDIAPEVPVLLDAKATDFNTANVDRLFEYCGADAITLNPYLGREAAQPFLDQKDKGIIVLCHSCNSGASEFQDLITLGKDPREIPGGMSVTEWLTLLSNDALCLYERVASDVATTWNENGNCALIVGDSQDALTRVRKIVGDMPLLVPYSRNEPTGDLAGIVKSGRNSCRRGLIISSGEDIIFASDGPDFDLVARSETLALSRLIKQCR